MAKYLVVADTYSRGYGCEITCFGVFDSEEEALKFILDNPVQRVSSIYGEEGYFDFFSGTTLESLHYASKNKYAKSYIKKFDGSPIFLGGYVE